MPYVIEIQGAGMIRAIGALALIWLTACIGVARADETTTYTYDALGRLVTTATSGGPSSGVQAQYTFDAAGNRTNVTVSGVVPPPSFSISSAQAPEGDAVVFTVTRSAATPATYNVTYSSSDGSAVAGSDYTGVSGTLTFAPSETTKSITVYTAEDAVNEPAETFAVTLTGASGGATIAGGAGTGTILDDDAPPSFAIDNVSVTEGGTLAFTVTKTGATTQTFSIDYVAAANTAGSGDFSPTSGTLTFGPTETAKPVQVVTTDDSLNENAETLYVNLSNASGGATIAAAQGVGTINDNEPALGFSVTDASATEGGAITFTVTRSGSGLPQSVNYATAAGSALAGSDFTATSGTLNFAAGDTSATFSVTTIGNSVNEATESFTVTLSSPTGGAVIAAGTATGTITDDDAAPSFSIGASSATEGGTATFTVTKTGATDQSFTVNYASATNTAGTGDFTPVSGTLSFAPGDTALSIVVATTDDTAVESAESFYVNLSGASGGATISSAQGVGTINDNDVPALSFSVADSFAAEGANVTFTVTRSGTGVAQSVSYATSPGTAEASSDFTAASGTLNFAVGDTSKTFTVATVNNSVNEATETFTVTLSNPTNGASITAGTATGTITDNDAAPSFAIGAASATEGGNVTFTVTKTGSTDQAFSVDYATAPNSAGAGDFTATSGTLTFAAGDTAKQIVVATTDDTSAETSETFYVNLSNASGGATISTAQGTGTINDNDAPVLNFSVGNASGTEGSNLTFTVTRSGTGVAQSVSYATAPGTAQASSDYTATSGTLSFAIGDTSKTFTVATVNNSVNEATETFTVNLSSPTNGATIAVGTGTGTINDNDAAPSFAIGNASATEGGNVTFTVTKTGTTDQSFTVNYATATNTAGSSDFTAGSGMLTFAAGDTTKQVVVATIDDSSAESAETFYVNLSGASGGATISAAQGVGTINDNDASGGPAISVNSVAGTEGNTLTFAVTRSSSNVAQSVDWSLSPNTAQAGTDYVNASGTVTFGQYESYKTVTVSTVNDTVNEPTETFFIVLSSPTAGGSLGTAQGTGTINDNDAAPSFSTTAVTVLESAGTADFVVTKTGATTQTFTVNYSTSNGSASAGSDYVSTSGTLTFLANEATKVISVPIVNDSVPENAETFGLSLSSPSGGSSVATSYTNGTINNDD